MNTFYYKIMSPTVRAILENNLKLRKIGLKAAKDFADKNEMELAAVRDGCFQNILITVIGVPKSLAKAFKNNGRSYSPKKNVKGHEEWEKKIAALEIKLQSPWEAIKEETGFLPDLCFDGRCVYSPSCFPIGDNFYLLVHSAKEESPIENEQYVPLKKWEWEKVLEEAREKEKATKGDK